MLRIIFFLAMIFSAAAQARDSVTICYNYRCAVKAEVVFEGEDLEAIRDLFSDNADAGSELGAIQLAIGLMNRIAGEQTPIHNDKGGNFNDDGAEGRMDCIDHSQTTTAYLRFIAAHEWLHFHRVLSPIRRAPLLFDDHWGARVQDIATNAQYVVDSWFFDNGQPAVIYPLDRWLSGAHP